MLKSVTGAKLRNLLLLNLLLHSPVICTAQQPSGNARILPGTPIRQQASEVLPEDQVRGENYRIKEPLRVLSGRLQFVMETEYGEMHADGLNMVQLRISEMASLKKAGELSRDPQLVEGLLSNIGNADRGIRSLLADPIGSLIRTPRGLERKIRNRIDSENRRAGGETRRKLARELVCDPETTNPLLARTLDRLSQEKEIGSFAGKLGLSVAVPGLGLLPASTEFREALAAEAPHQINDVIRREFAEMRASREAIERLIESPNWTTLRRLVMLRMLERMEGVSGRFRLIEAAAIARTEGEALDDLRTITLIAERHRIQPVQSFEAAPIPIARMQDGQRIWIVSADYLEDSNGLVAAIAELRKQSVSEPSALLTTAILTTPARRRITSFGIKVLTK